MQANPDEFQAIMLGKSGFENCKSLLLNGTEIKCEDSVKLLGVTIDYLLKIVSEYDQEIPQSQTADDPLAPQGRAAQPSRDTRKTN